jgi:hypothetical protein
MNTAVNYSGYIPINYIPTIFFTGKIAIYIFALFILIFCYGAAKLSYNYNMSINNGSMVYLWCILCFFFSSIYYPYYAFFLNPLLFNSVVGIRVGGGRQKM